MQPPRPSVFDYLAFTSRATPLRSIDLGFGRSATIWRNVDNDVTYDHPVGHTFSLYTRGGEGTRRVDGAWGHGEPGALCILPEGCSSHWQITTMFEFVHLYLPDGELRRAFAETFDRDARQMLLPEVTYGAAPRLAAALAALARAVDADAPLAGEAAMNEALAATFADRRYGGSTLRLLKGGLAPATRRRLVDFVEAGLGGPIRLAELAAVAGLSEFHLQRSFTDSFGVSPHTFVTHRRIDRAKVLIGAGEPIAGVAAACGFSSQSHLTRAFRLATGLTPGAYARGQAARGMAR
jgi:AraC family transcriptional regulator